MLIGTEGTAESASHREGAIDPRLVFAAVPGRTREEVLAELSRRVAKQGAAPDADELAARLLDREKLGCTGLGDGIAIPHCKLPGIDHVAVAVATTEQPVEFGAADGKPIRVIFLVVSPTQGAAAHLQALARVSRLLRVPGIAPRLREAGSSEEGLRETLRAAEAGLPQAVAQ
ncbi:MAG TPA: PTS sugar transporter subunit IIA [Thermoanaerobaculia bacterium]|jgi:mannitol/fructose-specific phosphotransferase system IIA component (Ntr-type)